MPTVRIHRTKDGYQIDSVNPSKDKILYKLHYNKKTKNYSILPMSEFYIWSNYTRIHQHDDVISKDVFLRKDEAEAERFKRNKLIRG